jgi:hypothetical protein
VERGAAELTALAKTEKPPQCLKSGGEDAECNKDVRRRSPSCRARGRPGDRARRAGGRRVCGADHDLVDDDHHDHSPAGHDDDDHA